MTEQINWVQGDLLHTGRGGNGIGLLTFTGQDKGILWFKHKHGYDLGLNPKQLREKMEAHPLCWFRTEKELADKPLHSHHVAQRKKLGACTNRGCPNKAVPDLQVCEKHRAYFNKFALDRYRKKKGLPLDTPNLRHSYTPKTDPNAISPDRMAELLK